MTYVIQVTPKNTITGMETTRVEALAPHDEKKKKKTENYNFVDRWEPTGG